MSEDWFNSRGFYASISALLLAGDIKATVVENPDHLFVKVWLVSGGAFMWSRGDVMEYGLGAWVYTAVTPEGDVKVGMIRVVDDSSVEAIAQAIATFDYEEALDFPMEHPADLELDVASS